MNAAEMARRNKERNPEAYCPKCLWRLKSGPCPRHSTREERLAQHDPETCEHHRCKLPI